jgi:DNA-binding response OmpR family regulator
MCFRNGPLGFGSPQLVNPPTPWPTPIPGVDDDELLREMFSRVLPEAGCQVDTAGDGRNVMEHLKTFPVDILITDLVMPNSEGLGIIRAIRKAGLTLPILAISGHDIGHIGSKFFLETATIFGATRTLRKPFSTGEFLGAVRSVEAHRQSPGQ